MKRDPKIHRFVKKLVEFSKEDGVVTEAGVRQVLQSLEQSRPRKQLAILRSYLARIRREVARQTAVVSSATGLDEATLRDLERHFSQRYNRTIRAEGRADPSLIAGVRVRVGDDLYDASITGRLQRLAESVH